MKRLGLATWSIMLPVKKLHQYSKFDNHLQVSQSLQSGRKFFRGMSYKKPFYLCPDRCILVHLQSHHFKGCPQQPWEEGKAYIVLPIREMQETGPERQGVDISIISVPLNQASLFSLWWGFWEAFTRRKECEDSDNEAYVCEGLRGIQMARVHADSRPGEWTAWAELIANPRVREPGHRAGTVLDWSDEGPCAGVADLRGLLLRKAGLWTPYVLKSVCHTWSALAVLKGVKFELPSSVTCH